MDSHLDTVRNFYREGASHALAGYQLLEELLKTYIGNHFEIAKSLLDDRLHFGFSRKEYERAPMGRLVQVFSKICSDAQLVNDLRAEIPRRDHIAHQSMLIIFSKEHPSAEQLGALVSELVEHNRRIGGLLDRLNSAHDQLIAPYQGVAANSA